MWRMERADVDAGGYLLLLLDAEVGEGDFCEKDTGGKRLTMPPVLSHHASCFEM